MLEHLDALYGTALRMTADRATAEDLVQDTYLRALRFRHKFEPGTNLRAWMFRMMVNLHINKCRRERRGRQIHEGLERHDMAERVLPSEKMAPTRRPEEYFFERMMSDDVARALDALPRDFKMVVLLADINGFRYSQIAEILNIPVGTVMSRLHRGRRLLRESLHAFAIEEGYIKPTEGETADLEAFRRSKQDREVG
ncbi:MAG: sigma-70 family RNA polymerase sigma factor [Deltaproteobacteria bacterium]|nr:sigma-70 family RNA polymerase sigma factor [Deltaproteobacteria bacterium]